MDPQKNDVTKLVAAVVRRHIGLFHHYPDIDEDDLTQEMLLEVQKASKNYNPAYRFDTFVCTVVQRKLINRHRSRKRLAQWEARYAALRPGDVVEVLDPEPPEPETFEGEIVGGDGQLLLVDWLHTVYVHARRLTASPLHRARRTYEAAQVLAVGALARKLNLSTRGIHGLFEDREDLRRVVGMDQLPSRRWFAYAVADLNRRF